jgi:hypothetical protein
VKKEDIINLIQKIQVPTKRQYLLGFVAVVALLALIRPFVAGEGSDPVDEETLNCHCEATLRPSGRRTVNSQLSTVNSSKKHRINSVPSYKDAFPDLQETQIVAANKNGVRPVQNREEAEKRKNDLVYVGESPYYHVDKLHSSIPYLVPRAAMLLQDIGQAFYDSLYMKGVPLNQLIVTSILRTKDDVARLQRHNGNATDNSCHLYGTTFDICYNRYHPVEQEVRNDTLKWVLSEVLRDIRRAERAYIKYEVKQGCFHMTVR